MKNKGGFMENKEFNSLKFEEVVNLKLRYLESLPKTVEVTTAIANLKWVLEVYYKLEYQKIDLQKSSKDFVKRRQ